MNKRGCASFSFDEVARIRDYATEHLEQNPTTIIGKLGLRTTKQTLYAILVNARYVDPGYSPPRFIWRHKYQSLKIGGSCNERISYTMEHRTPSIECAFTCPVCGCGYDKAREADACCKRARRTA